MRRKISEIIKLSDNQLVGDECFTLKGKATDLTILEFWRWHFSEIYDLQSKFAEYIVGKALGLNEAQNVGDWTLFDMMYQGKRIEVKETSYYHAWQTDEEPKSKQRVFGITKAYDNYKDETSPLRRQNDIYIFCLNTGETKETSNPLELKNWQFYVIPTKIIDEECGDAKTISLSRVEKLAEKIEYSNLKSIVDELVDYLDHEDVIEAHRYSNNHKDQLQKDEKCECFYCQKIFQPKEIVEWLEDNNPCDKDGTAICPYCGIDSVIGESSGYPISPEFLSQMNKYWFR